MPDASRRHDDRIAEAALAATCDWPRDIREVIEGQVFDPPPWNVVIGPTSPRGGASGRVLRGGSVLCEWGDPDHPDMAFSVAKSYIGLLVAVALDRGLLDDLDEPVSRRIDDPAFRSDRNRLATWRQLLDQTSEWGGELFGVPHTADRDRQLAPNESGARLDRGTPLQAPGAYWDYNDIRVNALCLALTRLFGRSLAETLADVHPAFAPETGFVWRGYGPRSEIDVGGKPVEVAVGGGHWGGGVVARVAHHVALGRIVRDGGALEGARCVDPAALAAVLRPCPLQPIYGGLWWLNTGGALHPEAPDDSVFAMGVGATAIWVSPSLDIVAVARWIRAEAIGGWIGAIRETIGE